MRTSPTLSRTLLACACAVLTTLSLTSQAQAWWWRSSSSKGNLVEEILKKEEFSTLATLVEAANLIDALSDPDANYTVFAPNNEAFDNLFEANPDLPAQLLAQPEGALKDILLYHVLGVKRYSYFLRPTDYPTLLDGSDVSVGVRYYGFFRRSITVNDANVVDADHRASNGIIHEIDAVLDPNFMDPPTILEIAADDDRFTTLVSLVEQAGFTHVLKQEYLDLTVFAPTNAAFDEIAAIVPSLSRRDIQLVLLNHIVRGEAFSTDLSDGQKLRSLIREKLEVGVDGDVVTINDAVVEEADLDASNGVVHIIDSVLVPGFLTQ